MATFSIDQLATTKPPKVGFNWLYLCYALAAGFVLLFLGWPLFTLLAESIGLMFGDDPIRASLYMYMLRITWNSVQLAIITTVISLLIAVPLAIAIAKLRVAFALGWTVLLVVPLVTPPLISSFATLLLLGRAGALTEIWLDLGLPEFSIYGLPGLVITQVLHFMPYALLLLLAGLRTIPAHLEEAAISLGDSVGGIMWRVVLPYIAPYTLMGALLIFLSSLGDVGAPLLIGGDYRVLPVEIYSNFASFLGDQRIPILFSGWIVLLSVVILFFARGVLKRTELKHSFRERTLEYDVPWLRRLGTALCAVVTVIFLLPYVAIIVSSLATLWFGGLMPEGFTLRHYVQVFRDVQPMMASFVLVAGALPLCLFVSVFLVHMNRTMPRLGVFDYLSLLPFVIPGVVIGVGLVRAFGGVTLFGVDLSVTALVLVIALAIRRLPYVVRVLSAGFARIDRSLEEAAWSLGASHPRTFKDVVLPQLRLTIYACAVIGFVRLITELGATLILYPPGWRTMTVYIFYYVSEGQMGRGAAMGVVLIAIVVLGTALSNRFSKSQTEKS